MAKALNIGTLNKFLGLLDNAVAPIMVRVKMIESRNRILAEHEVKVLQGIDRLEKELAAAEEKVNLIKSALGKLGCYTEYQYRDREAERRFNALVDETAKRYNSQEVALFLATVSAAKENITLACYPPEVRLVLDEVRASAQELEPKLIQQEAKTLQQIKKKNLLKAVEEE